MSRRLPKHHIVHENQEQVFPTRWFVFFCLCLFAGFEGIVFFAIVLGVVKGFTKLIRY